jgi:prepilin peptidase CpaA
MSIFLWLSLGMCLVAAVSDLTRRTIPRALTMPVIVLGPVLHAVVTWHAGSRPSHALLEGAYSVLGIATCAALPYLMWRKNALGGGDLKLFAALGALLLPRLSFEVERDVFLIGVLVACGQLAYRGRLFRTLIDALRAPFQMRHRAKPEADLEPALSDWFRLGPCFALGVLCEAVLNSRPF